MIRTVAYGDLSDADLVVDAVYEGQPGGRLGGVVLRFR